MPKLAKKLAKKVDAAEASTTGFAAWPGGKYVAKLAAVEVRQGKQSGADYWSVELKEFHDLEGKTYPGRQWTNLTLPSDEDMPADFVPRAYRPGGKKEHETLTEEARVEGWENAQNFLLGQIKGFYEAFGYTPDSDTDEMLGEECVVVIGVETQQRGKNAGNEVNVVNGLEPLSTIGLAAGEDGDGDDTDF